MKTYQITLEHQETSALMIMLLMLLDKTTKEPNPPLEDVKGITAMISILHKQLTSQGFTPTENP